MASNGVRDVEATPEVRFQLGGGVSIFGVRLLLATDDFYVPAVVSVLGEKSLTERLHKNLNTFSAPLVCIALKLEAEIMAQMAVLPLLNDWFESYYINIGLKKSICCLNTTPMSINRFGVAESNNLRRIKQ